MRSRRKSNNLFSGGFDIVFCRNVIIYFDRTFQESLIERFSRALVPQGLLVLGHSETITQTSNLSSLGQTIYRSNPAKPRVSTVRLAAGESLVAREPTEISTLVGSGVGICLYDPGSKIGGVKHVLSMNGASAKADAENSALSSMQEFVREFVSLGAERARLTAKLYGGAKISERWLAESQVRTCIGTAVMEMLASMGIPIAVNQLGGSCPVRLTMRSDTGGTEVQTSLVAPLDSSRSATSTSRPIA